MTDIKIKSIEQLKEVSAKGVNLYVLLNGGLRSSKSVWYNKESNRFEIENDRDFSQQSLSEDELFNVQETNIGEALKLGALFIDSNN